MGRGKEQIRKKRRVEIRENRGFNKDINGSGCQWRITFEFDYKLIYVLAIVVKWL